MIIKHYSMFKRNDLFRVLGGGDGVLLILLPPPPPAPGHHHQNAEK
jgi:hypothetical protein